MGMQRFYTRVQTCFHTVFCLSDATKELTVNVNTGRVLFLRS